MALLWFDGFDHYVSTTTSVSAALVSGSYNVVTVAANSFSAMPVLGGFGFRVISLQLDVNGSFLRRQLNAGTTDRAYGVGFHFYHNTIAGNPGLFSFTSGTTPRFRIGHNTTGNIVIQSGTSSGAPLATSANSLESGQLYHIETKLVPHSTTGSIEVRVNGQTWATATGLDTTGSIDSVSLGVYRVGAQASPNQIFTDNLYIWDDTGDENNDWLGERNVYTLMPDSDGSTQDWSLSSGSDTYALLNDVPDSVASYIQAAAKDDVAQIGYDDLPSLDITPIGVNLLARGQKTGTVDTQAGIAISGETPVSNPLIQDQAGYFETGILELNPATGLPWTPSEINAIEAEITRTL